MDRIARFSEWSTAIVVGEVIAEREIPDPGTAAHYESRVRVAAVLSGEPPAEVVLSGLGRLGADCSGGPRLVKGERVLLFLTQRDARGRGTEQWRVAGAQGKYALDRGAATFAAPDADAGSADALLAEVARVNESDPAEVDRAVAFAHERDAPEEAIMTDQADEGTSMAEQGDERSTSKAGPVAMLAGLTVAAAAMAVAAWRALRRR